LFIKLVSMHLVC